MSKSSKHKHIFSRVKYVFLDRRCQRCGVCLEGMRIAGSGTITILTLQLKWTRKVGKRTLLKLIVTFLISNQADLLFTQREKGHFLYVINNHFTKVKNDHRSKFSNLSNWKEEA